MKQRIGDWICTYTLKQFYPLDPRPEDVTIEDIAHSLSQVCRYGGHTRYHYFVAQHSVYVAQAVKSWGGSILDQFLALVHDASEAYLVDVPRPIKNDLKGYKEMEKKVQDIILERFGLGGTVEPQMVKDADMSVFAVEAKSLFSNVDNWKGLNQFKPCKTIVSKMTCEAAESEFLNLYNQLVAELKASGININS